MNSTLDNTTCMFRNSEPNVVTFISDTMITNELTEFNAGTALVIFTTCNNTNWQTLHMLLLITIINYFIIMHVICHTYWRMWVWFCGVLVLGVPMLRHWKIRNGRIQQAGVFEWWMVRTTSGLFWAQPGKRLCTYVVKLWTCYLFFLFLMFALILPEICLW